jgi:hypothetical protein
MISFLRQLHAKNCRQEKFDPIYWSAHFQFVGKHPADAEA